MNSALSSAGELLRHPGAVFRLVLALWAAELLLWQAFSPLPRQTLRWVLLGEPLATPLVGALLATLLAGLTVSVGIVAALAGLAGRRWMTSRQLAGGLAVLGAAGLGLEAVVMALVGTVSVAMRLGVDGGLAGAALFGLGGGACFALILVLAAAGLLAVARVAGDQVDGGRPLRNLGEALLDLLEQPGAVAKTLASLVLGWLPLALVWIGLATMVLSGAPVAVTLALGPLRALLAAALLLWPTRGLALALRPDGVLPLQKIITELET